MAQTIQELNSIIEARYPDNMTGQISPLDARTVTMSIATFAENIRVMAQANTDTVASEQGKMSALQTAYDALVAPTTGRLALTEATATAADNRSMQNADDIAELKMGDGSGSQTQEQIDAANMERGENTSFRMLQGPLNEGYTADIADLKRVQGEQGTSISTALANAQTATQTANTANTNANTALGNDGMTRTLINNLANDLTPRIVALEEAPPVDALTQTQKDSIAAVPGILTTIGTEGAVGEQGTGILGDVKALKATDDDIKTRLDEIGAGTFDRSDLLTGHGVTQDFPRGTEYRGSNDEQFVIDNPGTQLHRATGEFTIPAITLTADDGSDLPAGTQIRLSGAYLNPGLTGRTVGFNPIFYYVIEQGANRLVGQGAVGSAGTDQEVARDWAVADSVDSFTVLNVDTAVTGTSPGADIIVRWIAIYNGEDATLAPSLSHFDIDFVGQYEPLIVDIVNNATTGIRNDIATLNGQHNMLEASIAANAVNAVRIEGKADSNTGRIDGIITRLGTPQHLALESSSVVPVDTVTVDPTALNNTLGGGSPFAKMLDGIASTETKFTTRFTDASQVLYLGAGQIARVVNGQFTVYELIEAQEPRTETSEARYITTPQGSGSRNQPAVLEFGIAVPGQVARAARDSEVFLDTGIPTAEANQTISNISMAFAIRTNGNWNGISETLQFSIRSGETRSFPMPSPIVEMTMTAIALADGRIQCRATHNLGVGNSQEPVTNGGAIRFDAGYTVDTAFARVERGQRTITVGPFTGDEVITVDTIQAGDSDTLTAMVVTADNTYNTGYFLRDADRTAFVTRNNMHGFSFFATEPAVSVTPAVLAQLDGTDQYLGLFARTNHHGDSLQLANSLIVPTSDGVDSYNVGDTLKTILAIPRGTGITLDQARMQATDVVNNSPAIQANTAKPTEEVIDQKIETAVNEIALTPGPQGIQGEKGEDGAVGPKGDKGDPGTDGQDGAMGLQGIQGEKGETGDRGPQGDPGTAANSLSETRARELADEQIGSNAAIAANTAKIGISEDQATDIVRNNNKISFLPENALALDAVTAQANSHDTLFGARLVGDWESGEELVFAPGITTLNLGDLVTQDGTVYEALEAGLDNQTTVDAPDQNPSAWRAYKIQTMPYDDTGLTEMVNGRTTPEAAKTIAETAINVGLEMSGAIANYVRDNTGAKAEDIQEGGAMQLSLDGTSTGNFNIALPTDSLTEDSTLSATLRITSAGGSAPDSYTYTTRYNDGDRAVIFGATTATAAQAAEGIALGEYDILAGRSVEITVSVNGAVGATQTWNLDATIGSGKNGVLVEGAIALIEKYAPANQPGEQGEQGQRGLTGPVGPQGEMGVQGEQGIPGTAGIQGIPGTTGPRGSDGDTGPMGAMGLQGERGLTGLTGPIGPEGPQGEQGDRGIQGVPGNDGAPGPKGDKGDTGARGPQGDPGTAANTLSETRARELSDEQITASLQPNAAIATYVENNAGTDESAVNSLIVASKTGADLATDGPYNTQDLQNANDVFTARLGEIDTVQGEKGDKGDAGADSTVPGPQGEQGERGLQGERGITGDTGPQGPAGAQGNIGPQGIQGIAGNDGVMGLPGNDGNDGATGPQGPKGDKGDTGPQGEQGIPGKAGNDSTVPGPQGLRGPTGLQGEKGDTGPTGPQGPAGQDGIQGERGAMGIQGIRGEKGDQGEQGIPGPVGDGGTEGVVGPQGPQGPKGDMGVQGDQGPKGDTGARGAASTVPGPQGEKGETGATGARGATGPRGLQGVAGENGADSTVAGPQGVRGATGDTGPIGPQGPIGPMGEDSIVPGPQGIRGASGPQGNTGETGPIGETGPRGNTGPQGAKGDKGDTGAKGDKGDIGATGPQGERGLAGADGQDGEQGIQGIQGERGFTGQRGEPGPVGDGGTAGVVGPEGARGERGETGPQGPQGPRGDTGARGFSGTNGLNGAQGIPGERGPTGLQGETGPQGERGATGLQGIRGLTGPAGLDGRDGEDSTVAGPQGPQGLTGPRGATGSRGATGATGAASTIPGPQGPAGPTGPQGPAGRDGDGAGADIDDIIANIEALGGDPVRLALPVPHSAFASFNIALPAGIELGDPYELRFVVNTTQSSRDLRFDFEGISRVTIGNVDLDGLIVHTVSFPNGFSDRNLSLTFSPSHTPADYTVSWQSLELVPMTGARSGLYNAIQAVDANITSVITAIETVGGAPIRLTPPAAGTASGDVNVALPSGIELNAPYEIRFVASTPSNSSAASVFFSLENGFPIPLRIDYDNLDGVTVHTVTFANGLVDRSLGLRWSPTNSGFTSPVTFQYIEIVPMTGARSGLYNAIAAVAPRVPAFRLVGPTTGSYPIATWGPLPLSTSETANGAFDIGGNISNGIFTAPVDGIYQFGVVATVQAASGSGVVTRIWTGISIDDASATGRPSTGLSAIWNASMSSSNVNSLAWNGTAMLRAGQQVRARAFANHGTTGGIGNPPGLETNASIANSFYGNLVSAT